MAYRAEIQIALKGARELKAFQQDLDKTAKSVDSLNKYLKDYEVGASGAFNEVRAALQKASDTFDKTIADHKTARQAAEDLARAERAYNNELAKRNRLLREARSTTGFSAAQYGPQLPSGFSTAKGESRVRTALAEDRSIKEINQRRIQERQLLNELIEGDFKRMQKRLDNNDRVFKDRMRKNKEELRNFDKLLQERTQTRARRGKRRRDALGSGIIGGAFPLLFGQGAGAAVLGGAGGAAGGLVGGQFGFGLSLVGTAVGTAIDTFASNLANLASSLDKPTEALQAMEDAGLKVDESVKAQVESLLESGRAYEAQQVVLEQINSKLGSDAVSQLAAYDQELDKLNQKYQEAAAALMRELQPAMLGFVTAINNVIDAFDAMPDWLKTTITTGNRIATAAGPFGIARFQLEQLQNLGRDRAEGAQPGAPTVDPKIREQLEKIQQAEEKRKESLRTQNAELEAQLALANSGLDITSDRGFELAKQVVVVKYLGELEDINNSKLEEGEKILRRRNAQLQQSLGIARLEQQRADALARNQEQAARAAQQAAEKAAREEDRVIRGLNSAAVEAINLSIRYAEATQDREAAIQRELTPLQSGVSLLRLRAEYQKANIKASEKDLQLQKLLLDNFELSVDIKERELKAELAILQLERERTLESIRRQKADSAFQTESQVQSLQAQLASPFGGDQLAQQLQLIEQQNRRYGELTSIKQQLLQLDENIALETKRASNTGANADTEKIKKLREQRDLTQSFLEQRTQELTQIDQLEQAYMRQQQVLQRYGFVVDEIASGLSSAITALITGTESVEEAFSRMFANIGKAFIDMATKMLAQRLFLTVLSALGSGGDGGRVGPGLFNLSGGQFGAFAEGGFVTGPTRAIVGEGNQPEYIIPQNKMKESMARYSRGARGSAVIPQNGDTAPNSTSGAAAAAQPIDVRYTVERINSVDYVTADQFQQGMRQAAQQGAKQGEQQTLRRLQMSSSTRRRLGV